MPYWAPTALISKGRSRFSQHWVGAIDLTSNDLCLIDSRLETPLATLDPRSVEVRHVLLLVWTGVSTHPGRSQMVRSAPLLTVEAPVARIKRRRHFTRRSLKPEELADPEPGHSAGVRGDACGKLNRMVDCVACELSSGDRDLQAASSIGLGFG